MSIENSVDRIIELVSDSHEKAKAKGGTTSTPYLLANLPGAIESIKGSSGNAQPEHVLEGYTFSNDDGADKVGTCTYDADTSDADLGNSENSSVSKYLAEGYTGYAKGQKIRGNAEIADGLVLGVPKNIVKSTGTGYDSCKETANAMKNMAYSTSMNYIYPGSGFDITLKPALIIKQMFSDELETRANPEDVVEGKWCYGNDNYRRIWGEYKKPTGTKTITSNGTHDVTNYASASVNVPSEEPVLQEKTVSPTTSAQAVTPDSGYDGLSKVNVNAMPTATQATPSITVSSGGLITASATQSAGYVPAGTKSATKQLTTQAAKTVTPSTSEQTAVASGVYTTGAVKVAAIPSSYVKPTATKGATTYTPSTSNQTIASGTYCSGTQTIKGDANLVAGNIKSGVSIFGVAGNYEGSGGGGGGAAVETCTLTINYMDGNNWGLCFYGAVYTRCENGNMVTENYSPHNTYIADSFVIENIVKNTPIFIEFEHAGMSANLFETNGCAFPAHIDTHAYDNINYCIIYATENEAEITITAN